jgi:hypothetical protein
MASSSYLRVDTRRRKTQGLRMERHDRTPVRAVVGSIPTCDLEKAPILAPGIMSVVL